MPGRRSGRYFIAVGVDGEGLGPGLYLPQIREDLDRMVKLFTSRLGYEAVSFGRGDTTINPTKDTFVRGLQDFVCDPARTSDDIIALYFIGHGEIIDDPEEHVLCFADTDPESLFRTGYRTRDLAAELLRPPASAKRVLIMLDTCYSGRGGMEFVRESLRRWEPPPGIALLASALPDREAHPGVFSHHFVTAVESLSVAGYTTETISISALVARMAEEGTDYLVWWSGGIAAEPRYLPNPRYDRIYRDLDLLAQRQAEAVRRRDATYAGRLLPAARASVSGGGLSWDFTGRHEARRRIVSWLADGPGSRPGLIVTGGPGSGKTAVLGLIASLADPLHERHVPRARVGVDAATDPPPNSFDDTVYAGRMPVAEIVDAIAVAAGISRGPELPELRSRLGQRAEHDRPPVILIDAIDEAADPDALVDRVIKPLIADGTVRLVLGMRPYLVSRLDRERCAIVDLDGDCADPKSMRRHIEHILLQVTEASPFREASASVLAQTVDGVGNAAGRSFLIARFLARMLAVRASLPELAPGWDGELPRSLAKIMEQDLRDRLGLEGAERAVDLLRPLAFAEGNGLPDEDVWASLAGRLSGRTYDHGDVMWLRNNAGSYAVEATDQGHSVYRPYHQSLAEYLREVPDQQIVHRAFVDFLFEHAPMRPGGNRDWHRAGFYTRSYLATHIAKAGGHEALNSLMLDPGYLLGADVHRLLGALSLHASPTGPDADEFHAAVSAYRQAADDFRRSPESLRPAILDLAARAQGAQVLRTRMNPVPAASPWRARWLDWTPQRGSYTLTTLPGEITALSVFDYSEDPHLAVACDSGRFEIWNLHTGRRSVRGRTPSARITSLTTAVRDGRALMAMGTGTGTGTSNVLLWEIFGSSDEPIAKLNFGWGMAIVAFAELGGALVLHCLVEGSVIHRYDATALEFLSPLHLEESYSFYRHHASVDVARHGDQIMLAIGTDSRVILADMHTGETCAARGPNTGYVNAVRLVADSAGLWLLAGLDSHRLWRINLTTRSISVDTCPEGVLAVDMFTHAGVGYAIAGYDNCDQPLELFATDDERTRISDFSDTRSGISQVRVVRLRHDHNVIVAGDRSGRVRVWELAGILR